MHRRSCRNVVQFKSSLTGRTWKSGAVQMVQQLRLVPPSMHPRVYLTGECCHHHTAYICIQLTLGVLWALWLLHACRTLV